MPGPFISLNSVLASLMVGFMAAIDLSWEANAVQTDARK